MSFRKNQKVSFRGNQGVVQAVDLTPGMVDVTYPSGITKRHRKEDLSLLARNNSGRPRRSRGQSRGRARSRARYNPERSKDEVKAEAEAKALVERLAPKIKTAEKKLAKFQEYKVWKQLYDHYKSGKAAPSKKLQAASAEIQKMGGTSARDRRAILAKHGVLDEAEALGALRSAMDPQEVTEWVQYRQDQPGGDMAALVSLQRALDGAHAAHESAVEAYKALLAEFVTADAAAVVAAKKRSKSKERQARKEREQTPAQKAAAEDKTRDQEDLDEDAEGRAADVRRKQEMADRAGKARTSGPKLKEQVRAGKGQALEMEALQKAGAKWLVLPDPPRFEGSGENPELCGNPIDGSLYAIAIYTGGGRYISEEISKSTWDAEYANWAELHKDENPTPKKVLTNYMSRKGYTSLDQIGYSWENLEGARKPKSQVPFTARQVAAMTEGIVKATGLGETSRSEQLAEIKVLSEEAKRLRKEHDRTKRIEVLNQFLAVERQLASLKAAPERVGGRDVKTSVKLIEGHILALQQVLLSATPAVRNARRAKDLAREIVEHVPWGDKDKDKKADLEAQFAAEASGALRPDGTAPANLFASKTRNKPTKRAAFYLSKVLSLNNWADYTSKLYGSAQSQERAQSALDDFLIWQKWNKAFKAWVAWKEKGLNPQSKALKDFYRGLGEEAFGPDDSPLPIEKWEFQRGYDPRDLSTAPYRDQEERLYQEHGFIQAVLGAKDPRLQKKMIRYRNLVRGPDSQVIARLEAAVIKSREATSKPLDRLYDLSSLLQKAGTAQEATRRLHSEIERLIARLEREQARLDDPKTTIEYGKEFFPVRGRKKGAKFDPHIQNIPSPGTHFEPAEGGGFFYFRVSKKEAAAPDRLKDFYPPFAKSSPKRLSPLFSWSALHRPLDRRAEVGRARGDAKARRRAVLYEKPDGKEISEIPEGTHLTLSDSKGTWREVELSKEGMVGWVKSSAIKSAYKEAYNSPPLCETPASRELSKAAAKMKGPISAALQSLKWVSKTIEKYKSDDLGSPEASLERAGNEALKKLSWFASWCQDVVFTQESVPESSFSKSIELSLFFQFGRGLVDDDGTHLGRATGFDPDSFLKSALETPVPLIKRSTAGRKAKRLGAFSSKEQLPGHKAEGRFEPLGFYDKKGTGVSFEVNEIVKDAGGRPKDLATLSATKLGESGLVPVDKLAHAFIILAEEARGLFGAVSEAEERARGLFYIYTSLGGDQTVRQLEAAMRFLSLVQSNGGHLPDGDVFSVLDDIQDYRRHIATRDASDRSESTLHREDMASSVSKRGRAHDRIDASAKAAISRLQEQRDPIAASYAKLLRTRQATAKRELSQHPVGKKHLKLVGEYKANRSPELEAALELSTRRYEKLAAELKEKYGPEATARSTLGTAYRKLVQTHGYDSPEATLYEPPGRFQDARFFSEGYPTLAEMEKKYGAYGQIMYSRAKNLHQVQARHSSEVLSLKKAERGRTTEFAVKGRTDKAEQLRVAEEELARITQGAGLHQLGQNVRLYYTFNPALFYITKALWSTGAQPWKIYWNEEKEEELSTEGTKLLEDVDAVGRYGHALKLFYQGASNKRSLDDAVANLADQVNTRGYLKDMSKRLAGMKDFTERDWREFTYILEGTFQNVAMLAPGVGGEDTLDKWLGAMWEREPEEAVKEKIEATKLETDPVGYLSTQRKGAQERLLRTRKSVSKAKRSDRYRERRAKTRAPLEMEPLRKSEVMEKGGDPRLPYPPQSSVAALEDFSSRTRRLRDLIQQRKEKLDPETKRKARSTRRKS
jgi:hypothetical protein